MILKQTALFQILKLFHRRDSITDKQGEYIQDKISKWVHTFFRYFCAISTISVSFKYDMICWVGLAVMKYHKHHRVGRVVKRRVVCHVTASPWFRRQDKHTSITLTSISGGYLDWEHVLMSSGICPAITEWIGRIHSKIDTSSTRRPMFATVTSVESIVYNLIHCVRVCSMPQPLLWVIFIPDTNFFPFDSILLIQGWILNSSYLPCPFFLSCISS